MAPDVKRIRSLDVTVDPSGLSFPVDGASLGSGLTKRITAEAFYNWVLGQLPSATPGGSSTQVQFNNAGAFSGSANLVWDFTNSRLGIGTSSPGTTLDVRGRFYVDRPHVVGLSNPSEYCFSLTNFVSDGGVNYGEVAVGIASDGAGLIQSLGSKPLWLNRTGNAVNIGSNLLPGTNASCDFGGASLYWKDAYITTLHLTTALSIAQGGTGQATANDALNALLPSQTGNNGKVLSTDGTNTSWISSGGSGTVTSVAVTVPSFLSVSGSPITAAGTFAITLVNQTANTVFCGPASGGAAAPAFRTLVAADIPDLSAVYQPIDADLTAIAALSSTGFARRTGSNTWSVAAISSGDLPDLSAIYQPTDGDLTAIAALSGTGIARRTGSNTWSLGTTVSIAEGGTGQTSAAAAFDALAPLTTLGDIVYFSTTGTRLAGNTSATRKFLRQVGNGSISAAPAWDTVTATDVGLSNVENTALSTWAGSANITTLGTITSGTWSGTAIAINKGGTGQTTANAALNALLPTQTGNNGKILGTDGTNTSWVASGGTGTVTSVDMTVPSFLSVSGNPVTASGTLAVTLATQSANTVFAGPTTGSAAAPAFRALVALDIPDLSATYQPLDADLTAIAALSSTGFAKRTGANTWAVAALSSGDIPDLSATYQPTDGDLTALAGLSGTGIARRTGSNTWTVGTTVSIGEGGTGQTSAAAAFDALSPLTTLGDIVYFSTTGTRLAGNTTATKKFLTQTGNGSVSAAPGWNTIAAADVPAAGSDTYIQYNNSGAFAGSSGLTWTQSTGAFAIQPAVLTSGNPLMFALTGAAHTGLTASAEFTDLNINLARSVQRATGAVTTQRSVRIQAPTFTFVGASVVTNAITFDISGAPVAGTNATHTNAISARISTGFAAGVALQLVGAASQTGNYFEARDSGGTLVNSITGAGDQTSAPTVRTTGSPTLFLLTGPAHTTLTASTEATDVNLNLARTVQFAAGTLTTQRAVRVQAPTYAFASASTLTTGVTLDVSGAPAPGTNATITTSIAARVGTGIAAGVALQLVGTASQTGNYFEVRDSGGTLRAAISGNADFSLTPVVRTTGSPTIFTLTGPAHTTLTASTEATDANFNFARTVQFAAGSLTTQRTMRIQAATYAFASSSTLTTAVTMEISGAPPAGTNATITNQIALRVLAGVSNGIPLVLQGASSQGKDLFQIQDSGGTVLNNCDKDGYMFPFAMGFNLATGVAATTGVSLTSVIQLPCDCKLVEARAYAKTGPTGAALLFDINYHATDDASATTIWSTQGNRLTIAASAKAGSTTTFNTSTFVKGGVLVIDIDQIGSTVAGQDITVTLWFRGKEAR